MESCLGTTVWGESEISHNFQSANCGRIGTVKERRVNLPQYLDKREENEIRELLDELAEKFGFHCEKKEKYFRERGFYLDRLWYIILEDEKIPFVAFEIEKSVPSNERIRKDILNIVFTRATKGYLITPHQRILAKATGGSSWETWYRDHFLETFEKYRNPFAFYCDVEVVDADLFISSRSLKESIVKAT